MSARRFFLATSANPRLISRNSSVPTRFGVPPSRASLIAPVMPNDLAAECSPQMRVFTSTVLAGFYQSPVALQSSSQRQSPRGSARKAAMPLQRAIVRTEIYGCSFHCDSVGRSAPLGARDCLAASRQCLNFMDLMNRSAAPEAQILRFLNGRDSRPPCGLAKVANQEATWPLSRTDRGESNFADPSAITCRTDGRCSRRGLCDIGTSPLYRMKEPSSEPIRWPGSVAIFAC